jgi:hypothetical protein
MLAVAVLVAVDPPIAGDQQRNRAAVAAEARSRTTLTRPPPGPDPRPCRPGVRLPPSERSSPAGSTDLRSRAGSRRPPWGRADRRRRLVLEPPERRALLSIANPALTTLAPLDGQPFIVYDGTPDSVVAPDHCDRRGPLADLSDGPRPGRETSTTITAATLAALDSPPRDRRRPLPRARTPILDPDVHVHDPEFGRGGRRCRPAVADSSQRRRCGRTPVGASLPGDHGPPPRAGIGPSGAPDRGRPSDPTRHARRRRRFLTLT